MIEIVSVNQFGDVLPLNFEFIGSAPESSVYRGIYEMYCGDVTVLQKEDEENTTYQLPMPEFGV